MKHSVQNHAKRTGASLVAAVGIAMFGIGSAQADPTFTTANITVNSVGFLECAFKEAGLPPGAPVDYSCGATDVGWVTQCFIKSKPVSNIPPKLHVAHNSDGLTTIQDRTASNRGTVTSSILTAYPTVEEEVGPPLCPETEGITITEEVTAIRWCNTTLTDVTNNVPGASEAELFQQLNRKGSSDIPGCDVLPTLPTDI